MSMSLRCLPDVWQTAAEAEILRHWNPQHVLMRQEGSSRQKTASTTPASHMQCHPAPQYSPARAQCASPTHPNGTAQLLARKPAECATTQQPSAAAATGNATATPPARLAPAVWATSAEAALAPAPPAARPAAALHTHPDPPAPRPTSRAPHTSSHDQPHKSKLKPNTTDCPQSTRNHIPFTSPSNHQTPSPRNPTLIPHTSTNSPSPCIQIHTHTSQTNPKEARSLSRQLKSHSQTLKPCGDAQD